jgi:kynurenine formamidase
VDGQASEATEAIREAAERYRNWGRWGEDDVLGTLNHIDDDKRREAAGLVRRGTPFSLSQSFDSRGPQRGPGKRTNPIHTMTVTGAEANDPRRPHGFGAADDVIFMPLQASTQWDGLGHIFDHGVAWNGRDAAETVTAFGDRVTGIEHVAERMVTRGVLLDVGRALSDDGELPDGFAITEEHLRATIDTQGATAEVGRGDAVLVRTGQLARVRRDGWGTYAAGPAPGLSFWTAGWLHATQIAAIATDTWGMEVRPNEFEGAFQPLHQVVIPNMGLLVGEIWDLESLADDCADDGVYEFLLTAAPLKVTGAVGAPVHPVALK